jgi:hypothetical protein
MPTQTRVPGAASSEVDFELERFERISPDRIEIAGRWYGLRGRRFVQHRPIFGPGAMAFPERGLGVAETREKLKQLGFDPDAMRQTPRQLERARLEAMLRELHQAGVLDDDEFQAKLGRLTTTTEDK